MRDKRILYIASEDTPGMRPYASSVMKAVWDENSWAIIVLRSEKSKLDYASFPQDKITYIYFPKNKFAKLLYHIYPIKIVNAIKRIVKEDKIDLIHTLTGEITLSYVFASLQRKIHILHTVHDASHHDVKFKSLLESLKDKLFVKYPNYLITKNAKWLLSNSEEQVSLLRRRYPDKACYYSNFPTLVNRTISNGAKVPLELEKEEGYILFFGNVHLYKGVHLLYNAYTENKTLFAGRKLVIAGGGVEYFKIVDRDVIRINRFIDDLEVHELFARASVVVYPYISATQSGVLSIASYFGKKVVLSDIPFFRSVASGGGRGVSLVDVYDAEQFAKAIKEMLINDGDTLGLYTKLYDEDRMVQAIKYAQNSVLES